MTGAELRRARLALHAGIVEFGRALGYEGNDNTVSRQVRRLENAQRRISAEVERRVLAFQHQGSLHEAAP